MIAASGTIAERILDTLRVSGRPWDDDELAHRLGVAQRQTVNQICRRLASDGRINRYIGETGTLVNALPEPPPHEAVNVLAAADPARGLVDIPAGSSTEQREAELLMMVWRTSLGSSCNRVHRDVDRCSSRGRRSR